jgi:hypothetical protein
MIVHFHKDSFVDTVLVVLYEHSLIVVNAMVEEQDLWVVDKQYEMVLYRCHVVVAKCKDIEQEIEMVLSKLEQTDSLSEMYVQ